MCADKEDSDSSAVVLQLEAKYESELEIGGRVPGTRQNRCTALSRGGTPSPPLKDSACLIKTHGNKYKCPPISRMPPILRRRRMASGRQHEKSGPALAAVRSSFLFDVVAVRVQVTKRHAL